MGTFLARPVVPSFDRPSVSAAPADARWRALVSVSDFLYGFFVSPVVGVSMLGCALITSTLFSPENQRGPNSKKRVIMTAATNPITREMSVVGPSRKSLVRGLPDVTSLHLPL